MANDRSPAVHGSTCTTVPACSICTLEWRLGVMTTSPPSAAIRSDDCAETVTANQEERRGECREPGKVHDVPCFQ